MANYYEKKVSHKANDYRNKVIKAVEDGNYAFDFPDEWWISKERKTQSFLDYVDSIDADIDDIVEEIAKNGNQYDFAPNYSQDPEKHKVLVLKELITEVSNEEIYFKSSFDDSETLHIVIHRDYTDVA